MSSFASIAGWNAANLTKLDTLFTADAGGRSAADWTAIAEKMPNREAEVATIARIPKWKTADLVTLAQNIDQYSALKPLFTARSKDEKAAALASQNLLKLLKDELTWDDFAKCVELLGRKIPNYNDLLANKDVDKELRKAWLASNASNKPNKGQHEEGGWVYLNLITGDLIIKRQAAGAQAGIDLSNPPAETDSVVIAKFHTHPNLGPHWIHGPSGGPGHPRGDIEVDADHGVPDIVVAQPKGPKDKTLKFFQSGPASRAHLAGKAGLPGPTGGTAP